MRRSAGRTGPRSGTGSRAAASRTPAAVGTSTRGRHGRRTLEGELSGGGEVAVVVLDGPRIVAVVPQGSDPLHGGVGAGQGGDAGHPSRRRGGPDLVAVGAGVTPERSIDHQGDLSSSNEVYHVWSPLGHLENPVHREAGPLEDGGGPAGGHQPEPQ